MPPSGGSSGSSGSTGDGGSKDSGKADADAGPPPPDPGTPCKTANEIFKKKCGKCGDQSAVCLASDGGGGGTWSDYSTCAGEIADGCVPGTTEDAACGNCGKQKKTCTQYCAWSASTCGGQPANSCTPSSMEFESAGCTTPGTFRTKSCGATCTWGNLSAACAPPPTTVTVPPTAGSVSYTLVTLAATKTLPKLTGWCPTATVEAAEPTPHQYVTVKNSNAKKATVSVYNSQATGGTVFHTVLASYAGAAAPAAAARPACVKGVNSYGTTALTGDSQFASLDGTDEVEIAAGQSATIYVGGYDATAVGTAKLNVRLEKLE